MKTIGLYTWPTPNGHKIHIMLEETGTPYRVIPIDIGKGEQFKPDFLKISPNNKMPAMVDPDGPDGKPFALAESGAMLFYLAWKTGKFLPADLRLPLLRAWQLVLVKGRHLFCWIGGLEKPRLALAGRRPSDAVAGLAAHRSNILGTRVDGYPLRVDRPGERGLGAAAGDVKRQQYDNTHKSRDEVSNTRFPLHLILSTVWSSI